MGEIMRIFGTIRDSKKRKPVKQATIKLSIDDWNLRAKSFTLTRASDMM